MAGHVAVMIICCYIRIHVQHSTSKSVQSDIDMAQRYSGTNEESNTHLERLRAFAVLSLTGPILCLTRSQRTQQ